MSWLGDCEVLAAFSEAELADALRGREVWDGPFERTLTQTLGEGSPREVKQWYAYVRKVAA